jgi:hypothetical protein
LSPVPCCTVFAGTTAVFSRCKWRFAPARLGSARPLHKVKLLPSSRTGIVVLITPVGTEEEEDETMAPRVPESWSGPDIAVD